MVAGGTWAAALLAPLRAGPEPRKRSSYRDDRVIEP
jgi:hypothetical protein